MFKREDWLTSEAKGEDERVNSLQGTLMGSKTLNHIFTNHFDTNAIFKQKECMWSSILLNWKWYLQYWINHPEWIRGYS